MNPPDRSSALWAGWVEWVLWLSYVAILKQVQYVFSDLFDLFVYLSVLLFFFVGFFCCHRVVVM